MSDERTRANRDWANYRRFVHHKNALSLILNYSPPRNSTRHFATHHIASQRNADEQYDIERAADEEGVSVTDYLKEPPR